MLTRTVPLDNLKLQYEELAGEIDQVTLDVWRTGKYVLTQGDYVEKFETAFSDYVGSKYAIGLSSGTAALHLALKALGIGPGDEVIVPANTYIATVFAVTYTGARPVLADVDERTFTLDPDFVRSVMTPRTAAILPVHLFGHPADMSALRTLADQYHVKLVEDCAQAHGATIDGRMVGTFGDAGCYSFYPTKNLGGQGDAGAVVTGDDGLHQKIRRLRYMGQDVKYTHEEVGFQERMDEVQGAVLGVKLPHLDRWNAERRHQADLYNRMLEDSPVITPVEREGCRHVYYVYTIRTPERDRLEEYLKQRGVGTGRFYPRAIPEQPAYSADFRLEDYPVTAKLQPEMLSIPVFPGYADEDIEYVGDQIRQFYRR